MVCRARVQVLIYWENLKGKRKGELYGERTDGIHTPSHAI